MQVDFANSEAPGRYQVIDLDSGDEIENVAWADDDTGKYHIFLTRGRTLADASDVDLRFRTKAGGFRMKECQGEIEIVDLSEDPFKASLLALLDDPDVVKVLRRVLQPIKPDSGPVYYEIEDGLEHESGIGTFSR